VGPHLSRGAARFNDALGRAPGEFPIMMEIGKGRITGFMWPRSVRLQPVPCDTRPAGYIGVSGKDRESYAPKVLLIVGIRTTRAAS
jgi:hypothetical protein